MTWTISPHRRSLGVQAHSTDSVTGLLVLPLHIRALSAAIHSWRSTRLSSRPSGGERTASVTGAARGIGAATALALAARGIATALFVRDPGAAAGIADKV